MKYLVDKDTKVCGSFAKVAGSRGCFIHNAAFQHLNLNFIYKSFSVDNIEKAIEAMRVLNFRGAAVAMPHKIDAIQYLDNIDLPAKRIGVINTILHENGELIGYNTDYDAVYILCLNLSKDMTVHILGKGGMARTVKQVVSDLGFVDYRFVTRNEWEEIPDIRCSIIINCTPEKVSPHRSNKFIDCSVDSNSGKEISLIQASRQFELYTMHKFPMDYIRGLL